MKTDKADKAETRTDDIRYLQFLYGDELAVSLLDPKRLIAAFLVGVLVGLLCGVVGILWSESAMAIALVLAAVAVCIALVALVVFLQARKKSQTMFSIDEDRIPSSEYIDELMSKDSSPKRLALGKAIALISVDCQLTQREREVMVLLVRGRDVGHISKILTVSVNTVRTHVQNIYNKLGIHSRQELIDYVESFAEVSVSKNQTSSQHHHS